MADTAASSDLPRIEATATGPKTRSSSSLRGVSGGFRPLDAPAGNQPPPAAAAGDFTAWNRLSLADTTRVRTFGEAMVWEDGSREPGCGYHKVATYDAEAGRLQIEVFVAPSASLPCPVRIAVHSSKSSDAQRFALNDPGDADSHLAAIDERLKKIGLPECSLPTAPAM